MPSLLSRQLQLLKRATQVILWTHLVWDHVFSIGETVGPSMMPTFGISGSVLISKLHRRGRGVEVGDMVSYVHPVMGPEVFVIKRIIGMPGDFVVKDPMDETGEMLQVNRLY